MPIMHTMPIVHTMTIVHTMPNMLFTQCQLCTQCHICYLHNANCAHNDIFYSRQCQLCTQCHLCIQTMPNVQTMTFVQHTQCQLCRQCHLCTQCHFYWASNANYAHNDNYAAHLALDDCIFGIVLVHIWHWLIVNYSSIYRIYPVAYIVYTVLSIRFFGLNCNQSFFYQAAWLLRAVTCIDLTTLVYIKIAYNQLNSCFETYLVI